MIDRYAEIVFNDQITSDTWLMGLRSPEIVSSSKPGQFVMIRVRSGFDPLLRRPFSICGVKEDVLLVLYRVVGQGTAIMAETNAGEELSVLGPLGKGFQRPKRGQIPVLLAGGIGVAPLFFMAQSMKSRMFQFMMGFGSAGEIVGVDHAVGRRMELSVATNDGTRGHAGPVTDLLERYLKKQKSRKQAISLFACGPKPMLKKVAEMTVGRGIPCQVSLEASMACGLGACQSCAVKASSGKDRSYYHVCKDGPVFPVHSIDWDAL